MGRGSTETLCSSCEESHDNMTALRHDRCGERVETAESLEALDAWR